MTKRKVHDMTGTVRCSVCGEEGVHERGPGSPLVIRHLSDCPERPGGARMRTLDLLALHGLLRDALRDDTMCGRTVPTLKGAGRTRYGTGLLHALDAVEAELDTRAIVEVANVARTDALFMRYLSDHTSVDQGVDLDVANEYLAWQGAECATCGAPRGQAHDPTCEQVREEATTTEGSK